MGKSIVHVRSFVGLDVHAETIAVVVAERDGEVRSLGTILNHTSPSTSFFASACVS